MVHRMTWSHCGLEYHVHISPYPQEIGGYMLRICDEAFAQAPFCLRLSTVEEALENAILFVYSDATKQEQEQLLASFMADDPMPVGMVA